MNIQIRQAEGRDAERVSSVLVEAADWLRARDIGTRLMQVLMARYAGFHQHMLVADGRAIEFYRKCGFERAGKTEPMWVFAGHDH